MEKKQGWVNVGDLEGCVHYKVGRFPVTSARHETVARGFVAMGRLVVPVKYERIKFLVLALKNSVEVYAWAPKPYHKFMAFKVGIGT